MKIGFILLAGGVGKRMESKTPKQYLSLSGQPLIKYSLEIARKSNSIDAITIVCSENYQNMLAGTKTIFAQPGKRRQDSVYNGFCALPSDCDIIIVHDGARPFLTEKMIADLISTSENYKAATIGMPVKYTVKECDENNCVIKTLDRSKVWEIQTPQMIKYSVLKQGFEKSLRENLSVTDDVSLAELIGEKVKIVAGSYENIKITTPKDLKIAEQILLS